MNEWFSNLMGSSPQLAGDWFNAFGQYAPMSFWQNKTGATAPSSSSNLGRRVRFPFYPRRAQQISAPGSFANMTAAPHLQAPPLLPIPPLPSIERPSFTPSASTLPTDYNPSSQMYWMAPGYQSRPRTETQQRLLDSPFYRVGPNLSQEGKDLAELWGIDLSEKPEGWTFRPISYQEFYGKGPPPGWVNPNP